MTAPQRCKPFLGITGVTIALLSSLAAPTIASGLPPFTTASKSSAGTGGQAEIYRVDVACHSTFDRFVVRARESTPGYRVSYVRRIVADGTGNPVPLRGSKRISVEIRDARGHTEPGTNLLPAVKTPLCPNLRQMKVAGDFEGIVSFGLGLRSKTGFRVFRLSAPTRIVIDVAH